MPRIETEVDARAFVNSRTLAPRFANSNAICAPMPLDAPVTIATFPRRVSETEVDDGMVNWKTNAKTNGRITTRERI